MNKEKMKIYAGIKALTLLAILLSGVIFSMTACTPQQIVTGPGAAPTPTSTVNVNYVPSSATPNASVAGEVAITGILENGDSSFSFVNTTTLPANTVIYFTNYGWDQTTNAFVDASVTIGSGPVSSTGVSEGTIAVTVTAGSVLTTTPYTQIVIGSVGSNFGPSTITVGNVTALSGDSNAMANTSNAYLVLNHNGLGSKIFAYTASGPVGPGTSTSGITFINGVIFGPSGWNALQGASIPATDFADSYLPWAPAYSFSNGNQTPPSTGTFQNFCALDLSTLFNAETANPAAAGTPVQNQNMVLSTCETTLNGIENGTLWTGNNDSKTHFLIGTGAVANTSCSAGDAGYNVTYTPETSY
jgi:hypothetical protein